MTPKSATLYSLLSTLYSLLSTLYSLLSTLYSLLSTLYSLLCALYSLPSTLSSLLCALYSLLSTFYSLLSTLFFLLSYLFSPLSSFFLLLSSLLFHLSSLFFLRFSPFSPPSLASMPSDPIIYYKTEPVGDPFKKTKTRFFINSTHISDPRPNSPFPHEYIFFESWFWPSFLKLQPPFGLQTHSFLFVFSPIKNTALLISHPLGGYQEENERKPLPGRPAKIEQPHFCHYVLRK